MFTSVPFHSPHLNGQLQKNHPFSEESVPNGADAINLAYQIA
jgi:hypothetical protein